MASRIPSLSEESLNKRGPDRTAQVQLLMSPKLKARIDEAARAAGMPRLRYLLSLIEQGLPTPLDMGEREEMRMVG